MGHNRLGSLPDTRPWRQVVEHLAGGASVAAVAGATSAAAVAGLDRGRNDAGVAHVVYLLARTALAARDDAFSAALGAVGIHTPPDPGLYDLTAAFHAAVRAWAAAKPGRLSDLGEMATMAAAETLTAVVGERVGGLFATGDEVRARVRDLSTRNGFAGLAHEFFARFIRRFLLYHLGRELSHHVGGNGRFADQAAYTAFTADLAVHCREAAVIVRRYAGDWYDKTRFETGVTPAKVKVFASYGLKKLQDELAARGARRG